MRPDSPPTVPPTCPRPLVLLVLIVLALPLVLVKRRGVEGLLKVEALVCHVLCVYVPWALLMQELL